MLSGDITTHIQLDLGPGGRVGNPSKINPPISEIYDP